MHRLARRLCLSAALLLLSHATALGQGQDLQLTASIAGQRYCAVSAEIDALRLTLSLRYTNTGGGKIILYRGNRLFYQILVSRSPEEASARRYETRTTHSRFYDEQPEKIDAASPGGVFVTLSPGASYEAEQVIALPVVRNDSKPLRDTLAAGQHVLQVVVSTWYESKKLAQTLRERWQRRGFLWTDMLSAEALTFSVDKTRSATVCQ